MLGKSLLPQNPLQTKQSFYKPKITQKKSKFMCIVPYANIMGKIAVCMANKHINYMKLLFSVLQIANHTERLIKL